MHNLIEKRKLEERKHANKLKKLSNSEEKILSNKKFYSITRSNQNYIKNWLLKRIDKGKKFLDYCCGTGNTAIFLAKNDADVIAIDISDVSIETAKKEASKIGLKNNPLFLVMDGENLEFNDNSFDFIICSGVLHHLGIEKAYSELLRVLKPDGEIICNEPLAYNPIFQLYRKLTPHLRTKWETEHILNKKSIYLSKKYFNQIKLKTFHLTTLLAVPFRKTPIFNPLLSLLELIDAFLLRIPIIKWLAWQVIFIISGPKKDILEKYD